MSSVVCQKVGVELRTEEYSEELNSAEKVTCVSPRSQRQLGSANHAVFSAENCSEKYVQGCPKNVG